MKFLYVFLLLGITSVFGQSSMDKQFMDIEKKVVEWRRHFHQNPELSNREFKTAEKIAKHLKSLGIKVQTGVAKTGVVGIQVRIMPGDLELPDKVKIFDVVEKVTEEMTESGETVSEEVEKISPDKVQDAPKIVVEKDSEKKPAKKATKKKATKKVAKKEVVAEKPAEVKADTRDYAQ